MSDASISDVMVHIQQNLLTLIVGWWQTEVTYRLQWVLNYDGSLVFFTFTEFYVTDEENVEKSALDLLSFKTKTIDTEVPFISSLEVCNYQYSFICVQNWICTLYFLVRSAQMSNWMRKFLWDIYPQMQL
jgi:hypothetical protein